MNTTGKITAALAVMASLTASAAFAQTANPDAMPPSAPPASSPAQALTTPPQPESAAASRGEFQQSGQMDGIARIRGETVFVKGGQIQEVDAEMRLSEGITAKPSGEIRMSDGTEFKLDENQMITLDGRLELVQPNIIRKFQDARRTWDLTTDEVDRPSGVGPANQPGREERSTPLP